MTIQIYLFEISVLCIGMMGYSSPQALYDFQPIEYQLFDELRINDLVGDSNGNLYITGWVSGKGPDRCLAVTKLSEQGQREWTRFHESKYAIAFGECIAVDKNGFLYIAGRTAVRPKTHYRDSVYDYIILKYDSDGNMKWSITHDDPSRFLMRVNAVKASLSELWVSADYIMAPTRDLDIGQSGACILRYSTSGKLILAQDCIKDCPSIDYLFDVNDNRFIMEYTKNTASNIEDELCSIVKYDSFGNRQWSISDKELIKESLQISGFEIDDTGNMFVFCNKLSKQDSSGAALSILKYRSDGRRIWEAISEQEDQIGTFIKMVSDKNGNLYFLGSLQDYSDYVKNIADPMKIDFGDPNGITRLQEMVKPYSLTWIIQKIDPSGRQIWISKQTMKKSYLSQFKPIFQITSTQELVIRQIVADTTTTCSILEMRFDENGKLKHNREIK